MPNNHHRFMQEAIRLSKNNIKNGGGPFGAVIVKNEVIVAAASNSVSLNNDPTAHAEVNAIRQASQKLNRFDLSDCVIYTSCEPCPMCLGAIYWAKINTVYYANTKTDARDIGFDDSFIYDEMALPIKKRKVKFEQLLSGEAIKVFKDWDSLETKIEY